MLGKKWSRRNFFFSHEYRDQEMGEKRAKQFFQKHTSSAGKKSWKKIVAKSAKNRFLYSHEYRVQKMGEKNAKQFFQKHTNGANKKCSEKNSR